MAHSVDWDFTKRVFAGELVDLADSAGPLFAGVLMPKEDVGAVKVGITDQFLRDASTYSQRYAAVPYFKWLIEQATRGRLAAAPSIILDIGSGSGNSVLPCLELFPDARVVATDLSESLLVILRDHVAADPDLRKRLALVCLDATRPDLIEASVDLVVGAAILHHLIDPSLCVRQSVPRATAGRDGDFFEPFEAGFAILRLAYEQILARDGLEEDGATDRLAPELANCLRMFVHDITVRTGRDKTAPIFRQVDDKWLFTRSYFEEVIAPLEDISVDIVPINQVDEPFFLQTVTNFRLALGMSIADAEAALPDRAWDTIRSFDRAFSRELKRELPNEASVIFTRAAAHRTS